MADIVHSKSRGILIRKVGYSAGLEDTRSRISYLVDLYLQDRQITDTGWTKLVTEQYKRDLTQKVHFENFFKVIGVLRREQGRLVALPILEALRILKALLSDDEEAFEIALSSVLLYALTIADGELLANLIISQFDPKRYEEQLTIFREKKLRFLYEAYPIENDRRELHRCIDFMEMPKAGTRKVQQKGPFAQARQLESEDPYDYGVTLSDDWFRKVPGHRKNWAKDIGLWAEDEITSIGETYLQLLESFLPTSIENNNEVAILVPMDLEFSANYLTWKYKLEDLIRFDDLITGLSGLFANDPSISLALSEDEFVKLVHDVKNMYSSSDIRFSRIRKELPLTIFSFVLLGLSAARGVVCPSPLKIVKQFQTSNTGVLVRKSRNSLFSFSTIKK